jgi:hypothetical protein
MCVHACVFAATGSARQLIAIQAERHSSCCTTNSIRSPCSSADRTARSAAKGAGESVGGAANALGQTRHRARTEAERGGHLHVSFPFFFSLPSHTERRRAFGSAPAAHSLCAALCLPNVVCCCPVAKSTSCVCVTTICASNKTIWKTK